jgi:hypothetical protein
MFSWFTKARLIMLLIGFIGVAGLIAGARWYWINEGKLRCENAAAVAAQEKVVENDKKLRLIRSYRPSVQRVADRMRKHTF